jgi:hypothetical protein
MVNRQLSRLSLRCRVMLIVFAVITLSVELMVHATSSRIVAHPVLNGPALIVAFFDPRELCVPFGD